jgi:hypothetical protein
MISISSGVFGRCVPVAIKIVTFLRARQIADNDTGGFLPLRDFGKRLGSDGVPQSGNNGVPWFSERRCGAMPQNTENIRLRQRDIQTRFAIVKGDLHDNRIFFFGNPVSCQMNGFRNRIKSHTKRWKSAAILGSTPSRVGISYR